MRNRAIKINKVREKSELSEIKLVDLSNWEDEFVEIPPSKEDTERLLQIHKLSDIAKNKQQ